MRQLSSKRGGMLHGVLFMALFAAAAFYIGGMEWVRALSLSPMIVGIILGMLYANSLRNHLPDTWTPGIAFTSKRILRIGIILYGFRLTFQDVVAVGTEALLINAIIVTGTILLGLGLARLLHIDRDLALLTSSGSAICGAAAVLGVDGTIRPEPYKTSVAVATVVIFGTISMFVYPTLYRSGVLDLTPEQMGIYTGATVHEVAHVVGASNAMGGEVSNSAIIVKMIRVMMLVPVLLILAFTAARRKGTEADGKGVRVTIPWFAILFLVVIGINSLLHLSPAVLAWIEELDTFLLTMAMSALGAETSIAKFRQAGPKPFLLAALLFVWLIGGGYLLVRLLV